MENMMDSELGPQCAKMMQELDKLAEVACGMLDLEKVYKFNDIIKVADYFRTEFEILRIL